MTPEYEQAIKDSYALIREALAQPHVAPASAHTLVDVLESAHISKTRKLEVLTLLAYNIVSIDPHRGRYSWKVDGAA